MSSTSAVQNPLHAAPNTASHASATAGIKSDLLLMTCHVQVEAPDGSTMAILDSGLSASFISEIYLVRTKISGVAGFTRNSVQPITTFRIIIQPGSLPLWQLSSLESPVISPFIPFILIRVGAISLTCSLLIQDLDSLGGLICFWEWRPLLK